MGNDTPDLAAPVACQVLPWHRQQQGQVPASRSHSLGREDTDEDLHNQAAEWARQG